MMVLGKLDNDCQNPEPKFDVGGETVNDPHPLYICDNDAPTSFHFPDKGMTNTNGGTSAETTLGKI